MSRVPDAKDLAAKHLHDSELLAHLDGELLRSERSRAVAHLESCWECRSRLSALQDDIEKLIELRKTLPAPSAFGTAEMRVQQFRSRLMRHADEKRLAVGWWSKTRELLPATIAHRWEWVGRHRQPVLALFVAFCLLLTMFTDVWTTRLSAETILLRVQDFETAHQPREGSILKSSLRVERIEPNRDRRQVLERLSVYRQTAKGPALVKADADATSAQFFVGLGQSSSDTSKTWAVSPELASPVANFLTMVHWIPDLAPGELQKILAARGSAENSVRKRSGLYELHFPFALGHVSTITEAIFTVDAASFAPQHLSLLANEEGNPVEYRFTQSEFEIQPRTSEIAKLFAENSDFPRTDGTSSRRTPARVVPLTYATSVASEFEVAVANALHESDACLGDEIYIFPMSDGSLLLQGLVDSAQRREAVRRALKSVSGPLAIEIYLPRELKRGTQLLKPPDNLTQRDSAESQAATVTTLADLSDQRVPLHDVLYRHFSGLGSVPDEAERQVNAFSNEVVTLARQTFLHAWALKRLEREFSAARTAQLPAGSVQEINKLRADHRRWIETLSHRQAQALGTIVNSTATESLTNSSSVDTDTLLRLAQEQNDLVRALFTTSSRQAQPSADIVRLLAVLKKMGA